jgi:phage baseplate assembly protein W
VLLDFPVNLNKDIGVLVDEESVKNSIINLFSTMPGQKLLNPEYGLNLQRFVFEPITDTNARIMGQTILEGIRKYEPRVSVQNIDIQKFEDDNSYGISFGIVFPSLSNKKINLSGLLDRSGFNPSK